MAEFVKKNCVAVATNGGNTITFVTATGTVLARPATNADGKHDKDVTPSFLLAKFNELPEAERKPKKLEPSEFFDHLYRLSITAPVPPGMLVCRQYTRAFERDAKGELRRHESQSTYNCGPNGDFLWLTEAEWKSLVPADPRKGMQHPVPAAIARRIFVYHLSNTSFAGSRPRWPAEYFRAGELALTVEEASAAGVRLHLEGFARLADNDDFAKATVKAELSLVGVLNYHGEKNVFDRFDIAALGEFTPFFSAGGSGALAMGAPRGAVPTTKQKDGSAGTLGVAFELAAPDSLGYGVRPAGGYFTPEGASKPGT